MDPRFTIFPGTLTARRRIAAILAQEILDNSATHSFLIESEHQLCRRFGVSRVTVRLALGDLENRGLIYRKHGRGTFAHGRSAQIHRHIGVLMKTPLMTENRSLAEILRGVQTVTKRLRVAIIVIDQSPEEWSSPLASALAGVIVMGENVTTKDLDNLKNRKLPFFIVGETDLPGPRIVLDQEEEIDFSDSAITGIGNHFCLTGQHVAEALTRAFLTGEPLAMGYEGAKDATETDQLCGAFSRY